MKRLFTSILFFIFHLSIFAQVPANNDCANAINLTELNNHCSQQLFGEPTFDIMDGPCAPTFNPALNTWYKFTAVGTSVTIGASSGANLFKISLVNFPFGSCGITEILECNSSNLNATNLTIGAEYYIIISSGNAAGNFELCINNPVPTPPPNNEPCSAITLENEITSCGTTVDATSTIPPMELPCLTISSNQIWYQVNVPADQTNLEIDLLSSTLSGGTQVLVGQWTSGCTGEFEYADAHVYCGPSINRFEFNCMQPGNYYILLSSSKVGEGEFCITTRTFASLPECGMNDVCINAIQVPAFGVDQSPLCVRGCNIGACGEDFTNPGCNYNGGVVWYYFKTPSGASQINITLNSPDGSLGSPMVQIFTGNCSNLTTHTGCNIGGNGNLNLLGVDVSQNTTYLVAVGNHHSTTGIFDICFTASNPTPICNLGHEITVTNTSFGSPLNGPYLPGEQVSFNYSFIFTSNNNGIQWPHGVVPVAGPCWENPNVGFQNGSNGNWVWFDEPIVTYNSTNPFVKLYYGPDGDAKLCFWLDPTCTGEGLVQDDFMPPGWWHINQPGQCGGDLSDPNNTWGQSCGPTCSAAFSFTLTTKSFDECEINQEILDCGLQFYVFSDFQTGCWLTGGDNTCAADYPGYFQASLNCCDVPTVDTASYTICSGSTTDIAISSSTSNPEVSYEWTVWFDPGIEGTTSGTGPYIRQTLINKTSQIQSAFYAVKGQAGAGCKGGISYITVDVLPEINTTLQTNPENGCTEDSFDISAYAVGGLGEPYSYLWSYQQSSGSTISGISAGMEGDFPISVTITDNAGCSDVASTVIKVGPVEAVEFQLDKTVYCYNEGLIFLQAIPSGGEWQSLDSTISIQNNVLDPGQLSIAGVYKFVYSTPNAACFYSDTLEIEVIFSARDCPDKTLEIYTDGTESPFINIINALPFPTDLTTKVEVRIYDTLGKELYYTRNYQNDWNPEKYPAGLYFFIVTIDGKNYQHVISLIK
jgi:hypothetical protein